MAVVESIDIGLDTVEMVTGSKFYIGLSSRDYENKGTSVSGNVAREAEDAYSAEVGTWATAVSEYVGNNTYLENTSATINDRLSYTYHVPTAGEWYLALRVRSDSTSDIDVTVDGVVESAVNVPTTAWADKVAYLLLGPFTLTEGDITIKFTVNTNTIVEFDRFSLIPYRLADGSPVDESWFPKEISHEALKRITRRGVLINI